MLNPFPELLAFGLLATFVIRVFLGLLFLRFGIFKIKRDRSEKLRFFESAGLRPAKVFLYGTAFIEIIGGAMLLIGIYTQIASIALSVLMAGAVLIKVRNPESLKNDLGYYVLLFIATLSLLFLGAGLFAFDLPL